MASVRRLADADAPALWALRLEALEREPSAYGSSPEEHRHRGVVWGVYLAADIRGRAVGRQMHEHLLAEVRATPGVEWVKLRNYE